MARRKEIWAMIKGYEWLYWVSSWGKVKNKFGHIFSDHNVGGYYYVSLCKYGKVKQFRVNRLVALHFRENPKNKPYVNHKNCDKTDNYYANLEWSTQKENIVHAFKNGRVKTGELHHSSKLTNKSVMEIYMSKGSSDKIGNEYGVSGSLVRAIRVGEKWSAVTGKKYRPFNVLSKRKIISIFNSNDSHPVIMAKYGIKLSRVSGIKTGKNWSNVTGKSYNPTGLKRLYNGNFMTIKQICEMENVAYRSVIKRTQKGDSLRMAISNYRAYKLSGIRIPYKK